MITKSDKGCVPIIDKSLKYKGDVKMVLNDQKHYKLLDKNPLEEVLRILKI